MNSNGISKAWGGRFAKANQPLMEKFNASISVDIRMWLADILGNRAWAAALSQAGLLTPDEFTQIKTGLDQVQAEFESGTFEVQPHDEDIHMAVERRLTEIIGAAGKKIHTGRSRNDQVVTDFRLYLKQILPGLMTEIITLQQAIVDCAEANPDAIMPGYTHVQQAQPVLFSHYLLSFFWALKRDRERLADCVRRIDILPLAAGAIAGSAFPLDRQLLADELGFAAISENSMDAVSDRDFVLELVNGLTQIQLHMSRYAEDLIMWSSLEFGFVELDDAWSTGSSMMPQKKNPDSLELIRGKASRLIGHQTHLLTMMKGVPLTYAKDLQEDKEIAFDALDTVSDCLQVFSGVIGSLTVKKENMRAKLDSLLLATDVADYLVRRGVPFRESHHIVGQVVKWSLDHQTPLDQISLENYQLISPVFDETVYALFSWEESLAKRNLPGGTGPAAVKEQLKKARQVLKNSA